MLRQDLIFLAIFYFLVTAGAYFLSDFYIFKKSKSHYRDNEHILKLTTEDGVQISAVYLPNPKATYTVLVSQGNDQDLESGMWFLKALHAEGLAVFSYDYHGYGTSGGRATEKHVYADINAAYQYLTTHLHIPPNHIIAYGHSVGAAVAIDLAAREPVAGLIIESAFLSAYRTVTQVALFPFDKFNNLKKIRKITSPILVIHGDADLIVPFWQGKKLYEQANSPKTFLVVKGADHNDVAAVGQRKYWDAIRRFVQILEQRVNS